MKKVFVLMMAISLFLIMPFMSMAQVGTNPPPPPGNGGTGGTHGDGNNHGGGAPIDGGIAMLLVLGASVAGRKVYQYKKGKEK